MKRTIIVFYDPSPAIAEQTFVASFLFHGGWSGNPEGFGATRETAIGDLILKHANGSGRDLFTLTEETRPDGT